MTTATSARDQYIPTVNIFMPGCAAEEMEIRCALLLMRDCAMAAKKSCSEEAFPLLDQVERLTSDNAFRGMPLDQLRELRRVLRLVVSAAANVDDWASSGKGGDGRG